MKRRYIDLMEKTLSAYSKQHIERYFNEVQENGITEHGFPRLTANMGILIAHGRCGDLMPLFLSMMDFCCETLPNRLCANDFSIREIVACIEEIEASGVVDTKRVESWKNNLKKIDIELTYNEFAKTPNDSIRNWALFTAVSEYYRQCHGLCDSEEFIELQLCQQLQWLDENGMYSDNLASYNHQPMMYDIVPRGLFALLLDKGYRGKYYEEIDNTLKKAGIITLEMQSPSGEMPFGGRSNQFLHNEPWLCIIFEYEAKRYIREGNIDLASAFKSAALRALAVTEKWLAKSPISHIKNRYPIDTKYGCEHYAYFDKYMITAASFLYAAYSICEENFTFEPILDIEPVVIKTSDAFHKLFIKGYGYGLEFDWDADPHYDASGLGRVHFCDAPSAICLSSPCPDEAKYTLDAEYDTAFSLCSAIKRGEEWFFGASSDARYELKSVASQPDFITAEWLCNFGDGVINEEKYCLSKDGVSVVVKGEGEIGYALPVFRFDGAEYTDISFGGSSLCISYDGYSCVYTTNGKIIDTGKTAANRNGVYRVFCAACDGELKVKIQIKKNA